MSYSNVIGEKRAKEIASYIVSTAKGLDKGEDFPNLAWFAKDGEELVVPNAVLEMIDELGKVRQAGVRIAFDDTNKLRDYFQQFLPDITKLAVFFHYGYDKLKEAIYQPENQN